MAPRKIIIDTDPGVDDVLAILLALAALSNELEVALISVTYGNIDLQNCLRNVFTLFHHVEREISWRREQGRELGFDALRKRKPIVAVGPERPLADQMLMADFFHGKDGLGGTHDTHPHLTPDDAWKTLFNQAAETNNPAISAVAEEVRRADALFVPSKTPACEEILRLLRDNEPDTVTIVAIGPLTNLALAAAMDPETFLRVREVVVMGGTISQNGNITPVAEFNTFADSVAAARVYALTSPNPASTLPPLPASSPLKPYPTSLPRRLRVALFPLDITHQHAMTQSLFTDLTTPLLTAHSPLAEWLTAILDATYTKISSLRTGTTPETLALELHDPLCIWYAMSTLADDPSNPFEEWRFTVDEDIRVETTGQWTRGLCIVDRRSRRKREVGDDGDRPGDTGNWLSRSSGNRLSRCIGSPGPERFAEWMLRRIYAV